MLQPPTGRKPLEAGQDFRLFSFLKKRELMNYERPMYVQHRMQRLHQDMQAGGVEEVGGGGEGWEEEVGGGRKVREWEERE